MDKFKGKYIRKLWLSDKGISHIEVIFSFIIFISFTLFVFIIINPFESGKANSVMLDIAEKGIKENTESVLQYTTIALSETGLSKISGDCFFIYLNLGDKVIVKDIDGARANAKSEEIEGVRKVYIKKQGNFYTIYSFEDFIENLETASCTFLNRTLRDYELGLLIGYKAVSFNKLQLLVEEYNSNYESSRQKLNLPSSVDFGFIVRDSTNKEIVKALKQRASKINVNARNVPVQIVYEDGAIQYAMINIQTW